MIPPPQNPFGAEGVESVRCVELEEGAGLDKAEDLYQAVRSNQSQTKKGKSRTVFFCFFPSKVPRTVQTVSNTCATAFALRLMMSIIVTVGGSAS